MCVCAFQYVLVTSIYFFQENKSHGGYNMHWSFAYAFKTHLRPDQFQCALVIFCLPKIVSLVHVWIMGCDQGDGFKDNKGRGKANIMQDRVVDSQDGTGVVYQRPLP